MQWRFFTAIYFVKMTETGLNAFIETISLQKRVSFEGLL